MEDYFRGSVGYLRGLMAYSKYAGVAAVIFVGLKVLVVQFYLNLICD